MRAPARFRSFAEFWPFYLSEHSHPQCRLAHALGTSLSALMLGLAAALNPVEVGFAAIVSLALLALGAALERHRRSFLPLLLVFAVGLWAQPRVVPLAVAAGYSFAWLGHFGIEGNRPASFSYPTWSLLADIKLCALMLTGRLRQRDLAPLDG